MSVKVSSWVWHGDETAELSGNEMILLLALADVAADDGRCVYLTDDDDLTYAGLARKARVDRRTVIRLVARLRERGLLLQTKGTRGQQNVFAIAVPWRRGDKLSPVDSVTSETDSVTTETGFGDNADNHSSYRRKDVDVSLSPDESDDGILIPDDWRPNQSHIDKAASLGLDVRREYQRFREHAVRTRRRLKNWNAGFTNWLRKGAELAQQRAGAPLTARTFAQQKQDSNLALVARYQEEESRAQVGSREAADVRAIAAGA
jgi:hypothetical protein